MTINSAEPAPATNPTCPHPPHRLRCWMARDDRAPSGNVLVVCCLDCQQTVRGGDSATAFEVQL